MIISHNFANIISIENIFQAWSEFKRGKRGKIDVQVFERSLEDNIFKLHQELKYKTYRHGNYKSFFVNDPKRRHIHKAVVTDRVIHHLLYKFLYQTFDPSFIHDSYSCRLGKGSHKAVSRLEKFTSKVSQNHTRPCWALKCDIKKFFASVDHQILLQQLQDKIKDRDVLWLLSEITDSFESELGNKKGIPLGNLTSQVFANIYMNELDQFVKHKLKIKYYLRYADDFLILSGDKNKLERLIVPLDTFLKNSLKLNLHPGKIIFRKLEWGIDFLGYIVLPHYILPRTKTKIRIFKKLREKFIDLKVGNISEFSFNQTIQSYLGFLKHASAYEITKQLKNEYSLVNAT